MTRGLVLPLTLAQVAARARYLGGLAGAEVLDSYVRHPEPQCPDGFYLLHGHNGGKDPRAADPFDRWSKEGSAFVNRTADCIGGAAWCGGFDRYQAGRFEHIYSGWINTDSMLLDAFGPAKCFVPLDRPEPGCFVVAPSGAVGFGVGHIGVVVDVPAEWDETVADCWRRVVVVDVASRVKRANLPQKNGAGIWFGARWPGGSRPRHKHTAFTKSVMSS